MRLRFPFRERISGVSVGELSFCFPRAEKSLSPSLPLLLLEGMDGREGGEPDDTVFVCVFRLALA